MIQHLRQIEFSLGRKLLAFLFDLLETASQDENENYFEQVGSFLKTYFVPKVILVECIQFF